jgi:hypothetical protein
MAIPIPIGHTGAIRRFPVITVGLILINSLIFLSTTKIIEKTQNNFAVKAEELIKYELQLMQTYDFERFKKYTNEVELMEIQHALSDIEDFRSEIRAGKIIEKK